MEFDSTEEDYLEEPDDASESEPNVMQVFLVGREVSLDLPEGVPLVMGRTTIHSEDKLISRTQLKFLVAEGSVTVQQIGRNPSVVLRGKNAIILQKKLVYQLEHGDKICFVAGAEPLLVEISTEFVPERAPNFLFYSNLAPSVPDGALITEILAVWADDVERLEVHHGYIQWLFPLFADQGLNSSAHALRHREAAAMRASAEICTRVLASYRMMLRFYGIELVNNKTGEVRTAANFEARFKNLEDHPHNNLRLTRILTSLGHLGFWRFKEPLVKFFKAQIKAGRLTSCQSSYKKYWKATLQVESKAYSQRTKERPADRTDAVILTQ